MATYVQRTSRIRLRTTSAQRRRCLGLMVAAGDVWAWVIDCNRTLMSWGCKPVVGFQALCRELTGMTFGELPRHCAEDVLKRYSHAWFEGAKRKAKGQPASFPRRKRRLYPVRFRFGQFALDGRWIHLQTALGTSPLHVRLSRDVPYEVGSIRAVSLVYEAGELFLDVTARVAIEDNELDCAKVAGVDLGIVHPYAVTCRNQALLVSGRALRAEDRLHLEDTKRRAQRISSKMPTRGARGSRRGRSCAPASASRMLVTDGASARLSIQPPKR